MEEFVMLSGGLAAKTVTFVFASVSLNYVLSFYDKKNKIDWGKNYEILNNTSLGLAVYFGARIVAIAGLAGAIYG